MTELTLTARTAGSTVALVKHGEPVFPVALEYRIISLSDESLSVGQDGTDFPWYPYTFGTVQTLENVGDAIQFRAGYPDQNSSSTDSSSTSKASQSRTTHLSTSPSHYFQFEMTGTIAASGRLESLINYAEFTQGCFNQLFLNCVSLVTAPSLISTYGSIQQTWVFYRTFENTSITEVAIPSMFRVEPYKPLEVGINHMYSEVACRMFYNCTKLTQITASFRRIGDSTLTEDWLFGVPTEGVFMCSRSFTWPDSPVARSASTIPEGWSIMHGSGVVPGAVPVDPPGTSVEGDAAVIVQTITGTLVPNSWDMPLDQRYVCLGLEYLNDIPVPYEGLQVWLLKERRLIVVDAVETVFAEDSSSSSDDDNSGTINQEDPEVLGVRISSWHYLDPGYLKVYVKDSDDSSSSGSGLFEYTASQSEWVLMGRNGVVKLPKCKSGISVKVSTVLSADAVFIEPMEGDTIEGLPEILLEGTRAYCELYSDSDMWIIAERYPYVDSSIS